MIRAVPHPDMPGMYYLYRPDDGRYRTHDGAWSAIEDMMGYGPRPAIWNRARAYEWARFFNTQQERK